MPKDLLPRQHGAEDYRACRLPFAKNPELKNGYET